MGEILSPHVDRFSLVSSVIVIVVQDLDKPWPLEVYGRMNILLRGYRRFVPLC